MENLFPANSGSKRIDVVDVLRGYAIMSILLLHNLEHFDFVFTPENIPAWREVLNGKIWNFFEFMVAGKSYAIFALLFGFTFWLMDQKQAAQGKDFRGRFLWRMLLLMGFGLINSLFYEGDILSMYAMLGFTLVLVARFNDRTVLIIAVIMLLQPLMWNDVVQQLLHPIAKLAPNHSSAYFHQQFSYLSGTSLWDALVGNITNGKLAVNWWSWEKGRFLQAPALFMIGMLMGRRGYFENKPENLVFWKRVLIVSGAAFLVFYLLKSNMELLFPEKVMRKLLLRIHYSWSNLSMLFVLVSSIVLLYQTRGFKGLTKGLLPFGRMSLTSYMMQSIIGACVYYGFGLGLYKITDAFWCLLIGIVLFLFQAAFCTWWLKHHKQGPLEALWHRWTWLRRN
jgi:uncharacterized protein